MKSTGVVRRIDDLGRIVIPKEIRRNLRIRDGESLEIFVENDMIALKKFSPMEDLNDIASEIGGILSQCLSRDIIITDRDKIISAFGNLKSKYSSKNISKFLEEKLNSRDVVIEKNQSTIEFVDGVKEQYSYIINPIIANIDVIGLVIVATNNSPLDDSDIKIASIVSKFLGKHIEE